jgi:hypothetical protein
MSENRGNGVAQPDVVKGAPVADVLDEVLSTPVGAHEKKAPVRLYRLLRKHTGMALFYVVAVVVFVLVTQPADLGVTTIAGRWAGIGIAIAGLGALVVFPWLRPRKVGGDDSPSSTLPSSPDTLHTGRTRNDLLIENYHAMTGLGSWWSVLWRRSAARSADTSGAPSSDRTRKLWTRSTTCSPSRW